jgi:hypothetical protein
MFLDEPALGIGSRRFAGEFSRYHPIRAGRRRSGVLSRAPRPRRVRRGAACAPTTEERTVAFLLMVSLGIWLTYGLVQSTFLMRSMQTYFWITAGLLATLSRETQATH